jgi:Cu(I)/Ag(I) efflux system protein CusF
MTRPSLALAAFLLVSASAGAGWAQQAPAQAQTPSQAEPQPRAPRAAKGVGVVTELDPQDATVTLRHEPIPALGWPSMTMPFRANPPSLLAGLKVGQRIEFDTNEGSGLPEITAIRKPAR